MVKLLKVGSRGIEVKALQEDLVQLGYLPKGSDDGIFGEQTETAILRFQRNRGLVSDGIVGKDTYRELTFCLGVLPDEDCAVEGQPWIGLAKKEIGIHEVRDEAVVQNYWRQAKLSGLAKRSASEVPWCSGFVCAMVENSGIRSARTDGAKNWLNWGVKLDKPVDGCIVVFTRTGGGHVGFVMGEDNNGNLLVLGGNQGNEVNIKSFDKSRVTGYRYPENHKVPTKLTVGLTATELSQNEQ